MKTPDLAERFWASVDRRDPSDCWEWTGSRRKGKHPYGMFNVDRVCVNAMRVAWELTNGPIPSGLVVMHSCDNPPCCNPAHLSVGSVADNIRDMWNKGRARTIGPRGERAPAAKLNRSQVREIRARLAAGAGIRPLAREIGVNRGTVADIAKRRTWAWLDEESPDGA